VPLQLIGIAVFTICRVV